MFSKATLEDKYPSNSKFLKDDLASSLHRQI